MDYEKVHGSSYKFLLANPSFGWAQGKTQLVPSHLSNRATAEWSAEDHREAARLYELEAQRLEAKVAHLEKRVATYKKKLYRDTKGFRRESLKRLTALNPSEGREQLDARPKGS